MKKMLLTLAITGMVATAFAGNTGGDDKKDKKCEKTEKSCKKEGKSCCKKGAKTEEKKDK